MEGDQQTDEEYCNQSLSERVYSKYDFHGQQYTVKAFEKLLSETRVCFMNKFPKEIKETLRSMF